MYRTCILALLVLVLAGCGAKTTAENVSNNRDVAPSNPPKSKWTPLSEENGDSIIEVRQAFGNEVVVAIQGEVNPIDLAIETRDPEGNVLDRIEFTRQSANVPSCGGVWTWSEYRFLTHSRLHLVEHDSSETCKEFCEVSDSKEDCAERIRNLEDPKAPLDILRYEVKTTLYEISESGKFTVDSVKKVVTEEWLGLGVFDSLPKAHLRLLRNAVYAEHGLRFKSKDLQAHFSNWPNYKPRFDNVDTMLTELDKELIAYLKEVENR